MALSLPAAAALGIMGYVLSQKYGFFPLTGALTGLGIRQIGVHFILIAAPMFIMMGELMHRSGMSERLFTALSRLRVAKVPGRLIHTNIAASAVAATSGSSAATAATIGTVAHPNMAKGGDNPPLFLGSIAAGGKTLQSRTAVHQHDHLCGPDRHAR